MLGNGAHLGAAVGWRGLGPAEAGEVGCGAHGADGIYGAYARKVWLDALGAALSC